LWIVQIVQCDNGQETEESFDMRGRQMVVRAFITDVSCAEEQQCLSGTSFKSWRLIISPRARKCVGFVSTQA
jgi:hypothetical protein